MLGNVESWVLGGEEDPFRPLNIDNQLENQRFCYPSHTRRESHIKIKLKCLMNTDHSKIQGKLSKPEKNHYSLSPIDKDIQISGIFKTELFKTK